MFNIILNFKLIDFILKKMIDSTTGKLVRFGSPNKVQEVNFNKYKYRDWEYQNPKNQIKPTILNGNSKKKVNFPSQKEPKLFNNMKIYPQPNTKRTILSEFAPIITIKRSKKKVDIQKTFSQDNLKLFPAKRKLHPNNEESNNEFDSPYKRHIKNAMFQDYKKTQITTLPGPVLRDLTKINDDKNKTNKIIEKKNRTLYYMDKVRNDYCSNVECLPNSLNKDLKNKRIIRGRSYNNFYYKNKNNQLEFNKYNYFNDDSYRARIKREKNCYGNKQRPFSSNRYNININDIYNNYYNENNNSIQKYKNEESYVSFDMLKPSSIFDKKYELRVKKL